MLKLIAIQKIVRNDYYGYKIDKYEILIYEWQNIKNI